MNLPLLISVPHGGVRIPPEVESLNALTLEQIIEDSDEAATDIYPFRGAVTAFVATDIARAYVDVNRAETDRGKDGVVKTHTIYEVPIYRQPLQIKHIHMLLTRYYRPYHSKLTLLSGGVKLGIDCHTMAALAPPMSADAKSKRPSICLSCADGTCPKDWFDLMAECLAGSFGCEVSLNDPFKGGHIIRHHATELPWMQLELSRAEFTGLAEKRARVLQAFKEWCENVI